MVKIPGPRTSLMMIIAMTTIVQAMPLNHHNVKKAKQIGKEPRQTADSTDTTAQSSASSTDKIRPGILTTCNNANHFALTFDDGPYIYSSDLIDLLQKEQVTATFFVNGNNYWNSPSDINPILQKADGAGFEIASHTYTHPHLSSLSDDQVKEEMANNEKVIHDAIGKYPAVMRPPYGELTDDQTRLMNQWGYTVVTWSIDVQDWQEGQTVDAEMNIVTDALNDPASHNIILEHEVYQQTAVDLVPKIIDYVKSKQLTFVTVAECLGVDAYKDTGI
ncbi:uncharacterized protein BX664DRAFT_360425 [Halteromyces radiatus]|uniref:uncharacterized protein n=1 Tax=Halteromyces radiatus TaxID=101107 RepID=UPI002220523D|nr:uncharacterized protein BX664DRAFT_360425 [Halteromyces radiatus]KAI8084566.1 hypothetical protein BX664DRAFT_360425 [Halteromyces radiatus]